MPGRHVQMHGRWGRWAAGAVGLAIATTAAIAMVPADAAAPTPVHVTMGVTGATSSNCGGLSTGGSDIYVTPGGDLEFQTSVVGVNLLGLQLGGLNISSVANLSGQMVIDPSATTPQKFRVDATKPVTVVPQLASGDHAYKFSFDTVTLLSALKLPLSNLLSDAPLNAGVKLTYQGTIHVTTDAAKCGISVALPAPEVSAKVPGLPPIQVTVPQIVVPTVPVTLPTLVPQQPTKTAAPTSHAPSTPRYTPPPKTIPEEVMGGIDEDNGGFEGVQPNTGRIRQIGSGLTSLVAPVAPTSTAAPVPSAPEPTSERHVELAANNPPAAQLPVLLAILAIIALSLVTATYARLYLLRRNVAV